MSTVKPSQPSSIDVRDQYIAQVVSGKTFAEVGGLWGTVNEKISVAHRCNATSLTMIDVASLDAEAYLWQAFYQRMAVFNITNYRCLVQDICQIGKEEIGEPFDVVHCAGVLYHHPHPMQLLVSLRQITREYLILTSAITQEVIENEKGLYQIPPSGVIFIPALDQNELNILGTYWSQFHAAPPFGIDEKTAFHLDDFAPWWWLPTATALKSMCRVAGFQILESGLTWKDNALSLLLKVSVESVNSLSKTSANENLEKTELDSLKCKAQADTLQSEGKLESAEFWYGKAIELDPEFWEAHYRLGSVLFQAGKSQEAISYLKRSIDLNPDYFWSRYVLGKVLANLNRWEESIAPFQQAIAIEPDFSNSHHLLGYSLFQQSQLDQSIIHLRTAIRLNPSFSWSHTLLGEALAKQGHHLEAIAFYRKSIRLNPDFAWSYYLLGKSLIEEGDYDEATLSHQKGIALRGWPLCLEKDYRFTNDWFTHNISNWKQHLSSFIDVPEVRFLEIGSFEGMSTCWLLDHILTHPTSKITCIDLGFQVLFDPNIAKTGALEKVEKLSGNSHDILASLQPNIYDLIYVDGLHLASHVQQDAILSWHLLKVGGLMLFDDYEFTDSQAPGQDPKLGIDAFLKIVHDQIEVLHKGSQVFIKKISALDL
jgi:tetratricopeptide (TPR) repeat protein